MFCNAKNVGHTEHNTQRRTEARDYAYPPPAPDALPRFPILPLYYSFVFDFAFTLKVKC